MSAFCGPVRTLYNWNLLEIFNLKTKNELLLDENN